MSTVINAEDSFDEIRLELTKLIADQTARVTEVACRQDVIISNIRDRLFELSGLVKKLQHSPGTSREADGFYGVHQTARGIKLDFPRFSSKDPEGWLFQAEEYFAFHDINDDSQI